MSAYLGIDIGGTNVKIACVSERGRVLSRGVIDTLPKQGPRATFERIHDAARVLVGKREVAAAGVGCAGLIDNRKGVLRSSPNLPGWENTPLRRIAKLELGVYTTIDNDATSAAWGEYVCGANKGVHNLVFITLGTGVGGGIVADGRILRGALNYGGEVGHMAVTQDGPRCRCGARGCLEAYVGSYALVREARAILRGKRGRHLSRWIDSGRRLSPALIMEAARRGDSVGKAVVVSAGGHLGTAIASLINVLNPEAVVIGGGVAASFDLLLPPIEQTVARRAFPEAAARARIVASRLGNDATAVGAALFARDSMNTP